MRIVFVTLTFRRGGAENHMFQLIQHWPEEKDELHVVGLWGVGEIDHQSLRKGEMHALASQFPDMPLKRWLAAHGMVEKLRSYLKTLRPDVIVTFLWMPTWIITKANHGATPVVWSVQNDLLQEFCGLSGKIKRRLTKQAMSRVNRFIAISPGIGEQLHRHYHVPKRKIAVIPNSIDYNRIVQTLKDVNLGKDAKEKKDREWVLSFIGRLVPQKGWDILLRAVHRLPSLPLRVYVLGRGPDEGKFLKMVRAYGLEDKIQYVGFQNNPYGWIVRSDALISTSRWEPFGLVMAEAMALGKPVLATPTDGARLIIDHGENGFIFRGFEDKDVAEGIQWLVSPRTREAWEELRIKAQSKAKNFDAAAIAKRYRVFLQACLNNQNEQDHVRD